MYFRGGRRNQLQPEMRTPSDNFRQPIGSSLVGLRVACAFFKPLRLPFQPGKSLHCPSMSVPPQPNVRLTNAPDYRESYANSVQMRVNVWDFFLAFGTLQQQSETQVEIRNFQGIYLSPQQAKALLGLLQQNVSGYESAFGEIKLDPRSTPPGPVH